jgi:hypothetical protein
VETPFLIVHPGALGDVLQAVPALRGLRAAAPAARLVFAGQPRLGRLLVALGAIDDARGFDGLGLEALFTDAPIPPALAGFLADFARVVSWFGAREPDYRARLGALARDLVIARPVPDDDTPVWRHLVATLADAGRVGPDAIAPLRIEGPAGARRGLIVHAGSGGAGKRWPPERFAEVIEGDGRSTGVPVLLHQGPADREAVEALAARLTRASRAPGGAGAPGAGRGPRERARLSGRRFGRQPPGRRGGRAQRDPVPARAPAPLDPVEPDRPSDRGERRTRRGPTGDAGAGGRAHGCFAMTWSLILS